MHAMLGWTLPACCPFAFLQNPVCSEKTFKAILLRPTDFSPKRASEREREKRERERETERERERERRDR
jgi:hypothetical protein